THTDTHIPEVVVLHSPQAAMTYLYSSGMLSGQGVLFYITSLSTTSHILTLTNTSPVTDLQAPNNVHTHIHITHHHTQHTKHTPTHTHTRTHKHTHTYTLTHTHTHTCGPLFIYLQSHTHNCLSGTTHIIHIYTY